MSLFSKSEGISKRYRTRGRIRDVWQHLSQLPLIWAWWPQEEQESSQRPGIVPLCLWLPCKPFRGAVSFEGWEEGADNCPLYSIQLVLTSLGWQRDVRDIPWEQRSRSPESPSKYLQWVIEVGKFLGVLLQSAHRVKIIRWDSLWDDWMY